MLVPAIREGLIIYISIYADHCQSELPQTVRSIFPIYDGCAARYFIPILLVFFPPNECGPLIVYLKFLKNVISFIVSSYLRIPLDIYVNYISLYRSDYIFIFYILLPNIKEPTVSDCSYISSIRTYSLRVSISTYLIFKPPEYIYIYIHLSISTNMVV